MLFGFLLSLPFTNRFGVLNADQRRLYSADLVMAALATAMLIAPVSYHRLVFRQHKKGAVLRFANAMAVAGLASVAIAITGSVLLVVSVVYDGLAVPLITAGTAAVFAVLWFVAPLLGGSDDH